jgi:hypothetical protein
MLMGLLVYVQHTQDALPLLACGMVGCLIGFLCFNFPPAKIYLGDGGAYFLGFLIGELTIVSSHKGTVAAALIAPLFVLALPILDVSLAILRRGLRGLPLFRPDRSHIHHHLLDMGLSRRSAVLGMYCFTLIFLVLGFAAFGLQNRWLPVLAGAGILVILLAAGKLSFSREWFAVGHMVGNSLRMREEITYTLSLTNWLVQEARRVESVEEFWSLFTFAAERLGFAEARVSLADGERKWSRNSDSSLELLVAEHDFQSSGAGIITFKATRQAADSVQPGRIEPCIGDARAFHIVSELLAEAWLKASRQLRPGHGLPLQFGSSAIPPGEVTPQRKVETLPSQLSDTARL